MAITAISTPATWGRTHDTNRLTYYFSSNKWQEPNYQFYIRLRVYNSNGTYADAGTYKLFPTSGGTCEFNPAAIFRNYFNTTLDLSVNNLQEDFTGARRCMVLCDDYFGDPPVVDSSGNFVGNIVLYNGCQQSIPYDYITLNPTGNLQWVMMSGATTGSTGSGKYLTDATSFRMDNDDYGFLHILMDSNNRPDKIKYTLYYWATIVNPAIIDSPMFGMEQTYYNDEDISQSMPTYSPITFLNTGITIGGQITSTVLTSIVYADTTINFTTANSYMAYFPMGPAQLMTTLFTGHTNDWVYYKIDLFKGNYQLNSSPFYVYRKDKCNKYDKWQLFWLNPNGGYDNFTFTQKKKIDYKITRDTYKQKMSKNTYTPYQSGEKVFNTDVVETITLRTDNLTQSEAQILIELAQSPIVYAIRTYDKNDTRILNPGTQLYEYGVPYIVETETITYPIKTQDKEIFMEIKIRSANEKVIQKQ